MIVQDRSMTRAANRHEGALEEEGKVRLTGEAQRSGAHSPIGNPPDPLPFRGSLPLLSKAQFKESGSQLPPRLSPVFSFLACAWCPPKNGTVYIATHTCTYGPPSRLIMPVSPRRVRGVSDKGMCEYIAWGGEERPVGSPSIYRGAGQPSLLPPLGLPAVGQQTCCAFCVTGLGLKVLEVWRLGG